MKINNSKSNKVLTLTLNPALDITVETESINRDSINLSDLKSVSAGGKGFNTSRALNCLGINNCAIAFCGGFFKDDMQKFLDAEKIDSLIIPVRDNTRVNIKVIENKPGKLIELNGKGPHVKKTEMEMLFNYLKQINANICKDFTANPEHKNRDPVPPDPGPVEYFVLSGSLPRNADNAVYGRIIELLKNVNVKTLLDASGLPLYYGILSIPDILKINRQELEHACKSHFRLSPDSFIHKYLSKGIKIIMITNGPQDILYYDRQSSYAATPPDIEGPYKTGSGDSVNAGIIYSLLNNYTIEDMLRFSVACGNANILTSIPGKIEKSRVMDIVPAVKIKKLS